MIIPAQHNLYPIIIGTTWDPETIVLYVDGEKKDLTNCIVQLVIHDGDDIIRTLTAGNGLTVGPAWGIINIYLPIEEVAEIPIGKYSYYLNITEEDGVTVYRYIEGLVEARK